MLTDDYLNYKADYDAEQRGGYEGSKKPSGPGPIEMLFNFIEHLGIKFEEAMIDPRVVAALKLAGVKAEELRAEQAKRKQKNNLMLWGGAALLVGYLALRKK